ncbi:MAG: hypothetical protein ACEY3F_03440 [Wolbachia sp.]
MLSDIIKQSSGWDTKALAEIFSNKKFLRSVDGDKEKYLADLISRDYEKTNITLPREIIPDSVTLDALCYTHEKDPLTLPILLRYFTHKNLLQEAKDDLDKLNQKLQGAMDKDLKDLQDKKVKLQEDKTNLSSVEMYDKEAKALAINKQITETSSKIEEIKLYKEDIKNLLNGDKVKSRSYPSQYFSILNSELIEIMEKKLTAYVKDNTDIGETYQSLNSRVKKIIRVRNVKNTLVLSASLAFFIPCISVMCLGMFCMGVQHGPRPSFLFPMIDITLFYIVPIMLSIAVALYATAGVAHLIKRRYEQSFEKEMQDFIEGPKRAEKATNEDVKKLEQEGTKVGDVIDLSGNCEMNDKVEPSAPPKRSGLYPDLSEAQPPSYEEACGTIVQLEDSGPSSNLDSALPPSNTARDVIQS